MDIPDAIRDALVALPPEQQAVYAEFLAISDPLKRSRAITDWGRPAGTIRQPFTWLRQVSLQEAREKAEPEGRKLSWLARKAGLSVTRLSRITRRATPATQEAAA
ncbi:hypothetical protein ABT369_39085 [Dactylosporangium sp. NPDC000244]|uniref:hypothetical protein n=1 Tax=Dactylosporangium sp. NPDC000244 TaxID=3154365 RepID=UPI00331D87CF